MASSKGPVTPAEELSLDEILNRYESLEADGGEPRNPFKFLDSYGPEDQEIFFGREAEVEETLRHFYRKKHLMLYGESGSGKTSLVQCGLRGRIAAEDALFITLRSHGEPWRQLRRQIHWRLPDLSGEEALGEALKQLAQHASRTLVLVFDQFEELFIYHDLDTRRRFARQLRALIDERIDLKLLFVIRQEYLAQLTELENEVPSLFENRLWLRRMSGEDGARAVEAACAVCGVTIEEGLAATVVKRLTGEGGVELPYLQVVMDRLYRKALESGAETPRITTAAYEGEGRIEDILARFLEEEVARLPDPDQGRQLLKALVTGEGTKKVVTRADLAQDALHYGEAIAPREMEELLRRLIESRILREDPQRETLELRHDTLAATVFAWMSGLERELLELRQSLRNRHKEYIARKESADALLDEGFLLYLEPYRGRLRPAPEIRDFIHRSRHEVHHRSRRKRRVTIGLLAASFAVLLGFSLWNLAERAKVAMLAEGLQIRKLERQADEVMAERPVLASLLSLHLLRMTETGDLAARARAEGRLRELLAGLDGRGIGRLPGGVGEIRVSDDGRRIAALDQKKGLWLWTLDAQGMSQDGPRKLEQGGKASALVHDGKVTALALEGEGRRIAFADGNHRIWLGEFDDTGTPSRVARVGGHSTTIHDLRFSPDGEWLVSAGGDKRARLWSLASSDGDQANTPVDLPLANAMVSHLAFSGDGRWLASGGVDGAVRVWSWPRALEGETADETWYFPAGITRLLFSESGDSLAALDGRGDVRWWREKGQQSFGSPRVAPGHLPLPAGERQKSPSPLGERGWGEGEMSESAERFKSSTSRLPAIAASSSEGGRGEGALHSSWVEARNISVLRGLRDIALDPAGRRLATVNSEGAIALHGAGDDGGSSSFRHLESDAPVTQIRFAGEWLIGVDEARRIAGWWLDDGGNPIEAIELRGHEAAITALAIAARRLVSGDEQGVLRLSGIQVPDPFKDGNPDLDSNMTGEGITALALDGDSLYAGGARGAIGSWIMGASHQPTRGVIGSQNRAAEFLAVSPHGLISAGGGEGARLWPLAEGRAFARTPSAIPLETKKGQRLHLGPRGKWLAGIDELGRIQLWRVAEAGAGIEQRTPILEDVRVRHARFSPDGGRLALFGWDRRILLLDLGRLDGAVEGRTLAGHASLVNRVRFSRNGRWLAAADLHNRWRLWDLEPARGGIGEGREIEPDDAPFDITLDGEVVPSEGAGQEDETFVAPDGDWQLQRDEEGALQLVDLRNQNEPANRNPHRLPPACSRQLQGAFDGEGGLVTLSDAAILRRWDLNQPRPWEIPRVLPGIPPNGVLAHDPRGWLLSGEAGRVRSIPLPQAIEGCRVEDHKLEFVSDHPPLRIQPLADTGRFVLIGADGRGRFIRLNETGGLKTEKTFMLDLEAGKAGHGEDIPLALSGLMGGMGMAPTRESLTQAAWSGDGEWAVTLTASRRVALWRHREKGFERTRELTWPKGLDAAGVAISPTGRWLALGFRQGQVGLYDLHDSGDPVMTPLGAHPSSVRQLRFGLGEGDLFSGDDQGAIRRWLVGRERLARQTCDLAGGHVQSMALAEILGEEQASICDLAARTGQ